MEKELCKAILEAAKIREVPDDEFKEVNAKDTKL